MEGINDEMDQELNELRQQYYQKQLRKQREKRDQQRQLQVEQRKQQQQQQHKQMQQQHKQMQQQHKQMQQQHNNNSNKRGKSLKHNKSNCNPGEQPRGLTTTKDKEVCISHNKRKANESIGRCLKETIVIIMST